MFTLNASEFPLVSYLVAAYNEERYIEPCLYSLINQEYPNLEIIFVDDGSSDHTFAKAKLLLESQTLINFKLIQQSSNYGKCKAFNDAFSMSRGDIITLIGADDIAPVFRTILAVSYMRKYKTTYIYGCYQKFTYSSEIDLQPLSRLPSINRFYYNAVPGGTSFIVRSLAERLFPIPANLPAEDWYLSFFAENYHHKPISVTHNFLFYRVSSSNAVSTISFSSYTAALLRELDVLYKFKELSPVSSVHLRLSILLRQKLLVFIQAPSIFLMHWFALGLLSPIRSRFLKALILYLTK